MRKNAANIANNAEIWSDDEVEATADEPAQESNPEIVPAEEANAKGDSDDDRDGEHDNEGESEENPPTRNSEKIEDSNSVGTIDEEQRPPKMNDGDEDIKLSNNGKYEEDEISGFELMSLLSSICEVLFLGLYSIIHDM